MRSNIILCGLPSVGKSCAGKFLAEKLNWDFVDTDRLLENDFLKHTAKAYSCREIYQEVGENQFRLYEKKLLTSLQGSVNTVFALGGGTLQEAENVNMVKNMGIIVYLENDYDLLYARICQKPCLPAFLQSSDPYTSFKNMVKLREPIYKSVADYTLGTNGLSVHHVVEKLLKWTQFLLN